MASLTTNPPNKVGSTYTVTISLSATVGLDSPVSVSLNLVLKNPCVHTVSYDAPVIGEVTYMLGSDTEVIDVDKFISNPYRSYCTISDYDATNSINADPLIVLDDSTDPMKLSVYRAELLTFSSDNNYASTVVTVTIEGNHLGYIYPSMTFDIKVENPCVDEAVSYYGTDFNSSPYVYYLWASDERISVPAIFEASAASDFPATDLSFCVMTQQLDSNVYEVSSNDLVSSSVSKTLTSNEIVI